MINRMINLLVGMLLKRVLREEVRLQGLKAVRAYIAAVGKARLGVMAVVGLIGVVSLLVAGLVLTVGAILALVGVEGPALQWVALVMGILLLALGIVVLVMLLSQRRWLQMSKSYELMDAVIEPVPSVAAVPQNLLRAFKGQPTVHATRETIQPPPPRERIATLRPPRAPMRPQEV